MTPHGKPKSSSAEAFISADSRYGLVYLKLGVIMKHVMGNDQDTITPDQEAEILVCRTPIRLPAGGNHLVFQNEEREFGTLNMRTGKLSVFHSSGEMKSDQLPWS